MPIANVTFNGSDKEIVCQPNQLGAGGKLIQVTSSPEACNGSHRLEFLAAKGPLQAVGDGLFVVPFKNGSVHGATNLNDFRLAVTDLDGFGTTLHVVPAALEPVLILVRRIDFLYKHIFHVRQTGSGRPGEVIIVANQHAGNSGKAHTDDVQASAAEMNLVGNLWRRESHLRSTDEDCVAGSRAAGSYHPGVAAPAAEQSILFSVRTNLSEIRRGLCACQ